VRDDRNRKFLDRLTDQGGHGIFWSVIVGFAAIGYLSQLIWIMSF